MNHGMRYMCPISNLPTAFSEGISHADICSFANILFQHCWQQDAESVYQKFTSELGFEKQHTSLLIDGSRRKILEAVDNMVEQMGGSDVVVFYFSGHVSGHQEVARERGCIDHDQCDQS